MPTGCALQKTGCGLRPRTRNVLLLTLTIAAGSADAVSYLGLGRVFTANMTGNLVLLGVAVGQGALGGSLRSLIAFAGFGIGLLVGARLTARSRTSVVWPPSVTLVVTIEVGLLAAFAAGWRSLENGPQRSRSTCSSFSQPVRWGCRPPPRAGSTWWD